MIDAQSGMENQDQKIFSLIVKNQRGLIILVNKFDLINNKKEEQLKSKKNKRKNSSIC